MTKAVSIIGIIFTFLLAAILYLVSFAYALVWKKQPSKDETYYDVKLKTSSLGNYEINVRAYERPSHAVLPIISSKYYTYSESKYTTEVKNKAPKAVYKAKTISKVDVVFALGRLSQQSALQSYIPTFTSELESAGNNIDAQVSQVETTDIKFTNEFDWRLFGGGDEQDMGGFVGPQIGFGHNGDSGWITFGGYSVAGPRDGAWLPLPKTKKLEISFILDLNGINRHSGADFGFRFGGAETGPDDGDWAEIGAHTGGVWYAESDGFRTSLYAPSKRFLVKVVANPQTGDLVITIGGIEVLSRTGVKMSSNSLFIHFQHLPHHCERKSRTEITSVRMKVGSQKTLGDSLSDVDWRDGATRFIVHATDELPEESKPGNEGKFAYTVTKLLSSNAYLINLGKSTNKAELDKILKAIQSADGTTKGTYYDNTPITEAMDKSADYIINIARKLSKPTNWVLVNTDMLWDTEYTDNERDVPLNFGEHNGTRKQPQDKSDITLARTWGISLTDLYEGDKYMAEKWRYRHSPTFFDNSNTKAAFDHMWMTDPIGVFDYTGKYRVNYKRRDNPLHTNADLTNAFDNYRLWSTNYDRLDSK